MRAQQEVVVYVPAGGHLATEGIARGSAIVGQPYSDENEVRIYFEGAIYGQVGMATLADRAVCAWGRLVMRYPTTASRVVPREALTVVGTLNPAAGRIVLTGPTSAREVAEWLGGPDLDAAELGPTRFPLR
jgi:hypothetical protein